MTVIESEVVFASPGDPSSGIQWAEHKGALLLLDVHAEEREILTAFGPADAVRATITVLDGEHVGDTYPDCLVFPKVLAAQLRSRIGKKVLGRLGQGQAKSGQSPPWLLAEASATDVLIGKAHVEKQAPAVVSAAPPF